MATYKELKAKAEDLLRQAEAARKAEIAAVIAEIQAKMKEYGLSVADLGAGAKLVKARKAVGAKYRNPANSDTWSGRGRVPRWLAALEGAGRKREEFAVK